MLKSLATNKGNTLYAIAHKETQAPKLLLPNRVIVLNDTIQLLATSDPSYTARNCYAM